MVTVILSVVLCGCESLSLWDIISQLCGHLRIGSLESS
jgi:hypothetical protein